MKKHMILLSQCLFCWFFVPTLSAQQRTGEMNAYRQSRIDSGDQVLDEWVETIGLGKRARRQTVLKIRRGDEIQMARFNVNGDRLQDEDADINDVELTWQDKISARLVLRYRAGNGGIDDAIRNTVLVLLTDDKPLSLAEFATTYMPELTNSNDMLVADRAMQRRKYSDALANSSKHLKVISNHHDGLIDRFLQATEFDDKAVVNRLQFAPVIALDVSWNELKVLAIRDDVRYVFANEVLEPELDIAAESLLAPTVWAAGNGETGAGVNVAVVGEEGRVSKCNPYLTVFAQQYPAIPVSNHATSVAGVIASKLVIGGNKHFGVAHNANLMCASSGKTDFISVAKDSEWAIKSEASILNMSVGEVSCFGTLHLLDIVADYQVFHGRRSWITSAGNRGHKEGLTTSPANGLNVLAVGSIDDGNTAAWDDDVVFHTSSFRNPLTGAEKPEIAAYGVDIRTTSAATPWHNNKTGTSFASPAVAGIAALCVERDQALHAWPEAIKAKVLVSGLAHDVEPGSIDKDGLGCAKATAVRTGHATLNLTEQDFMGGDLLTVPMVTVDLNEGDPFRLVMGYSLNPVMVTADPSTSSYDRIDLDLELWIGGSMVASSNNGTENTFEVIDYTHDAGMTGEIKIRKVEWKPKYTKMFPIGLAWASQSTLGVSP